MLVAAIAVVLVGFALGLPGSASQGSIGLALLNVMEFNQSLSMLVKSWTGLETSLGAIARLKSFLADTRAEGSEQDDVSPPSSWPDRGAIQINSITAKYKSVALSSLVSSFIQRPVVASVTHSRSPRFGASA